MSDMNENENSGTETVTKFQESANQESMMRYGFYVCLWTAVCLTILGVVSYFAILFVSKFTTLSINGGDVLDSLLPYVLMFLVVGFSGKSIQKLIENLPAILEALSKLKKTPLN